MRDINAAAHWSATSPLHMSITLLIATLNDLVASALAAKADEAIRQWWSQKPVDAAVEATARVFESEYDGLGAQLRAWSRDKAVAEVLVVIARGTYAQHDAVNTLLGALSRAGFDQPPNGTPAKDVLVQFFNQYRLAILASENNTYTASYITTRIDTRHADTKNELGIIREILDARLPPAALGTVASPMLSEATAEVPSEVENAKRLLEGGHPRAALELLQMLETDSRPLSEQARYETAATRGNALMQLGEPAEAEKSFDVALALRPHRANAIANIGHAKLMQGDHAGALERAELALAAEADNASALRLKIQALTLLGQLEPALVLAPKISDELEREQVLGFIALRQEDGAGALAHYKAAQALQPKNPVLLGRLAHAHVMVLQEALRGTGHSPLGQLPVAVRSAAEEAAGWLDKAIAALEQTDERQDLAQALFDRATLRAYLGDDAADADFTRGLELDRLHAGAIRQAATFWLTNGAPDKAAPYIERLRAAGKSSWETDVLYARVLLELGRTPEAERVLDALGSDDPGRTLEATLVRLEGRIDCRDWAGAELLVGKIPEQHRLDWKVAALTADLLGKQGKAEAAVELLKAAIEQVAPENLWRLQLSLARQLLALERWDEASDEFRTILGSNAPAGLLRQYVSALYNADRVEECLNVCRAIQAQKGFVPEVAEVEALAQSALGQLQKSDAIYAELQSREPSEPKWRLRRAFIALRGGDRDQVVGLLPSIEETAALDWQDGLEVAGLQSLMGDLRASLETAYRVARANPTEPQAQLRYVGIFFGADSALGDSLQTDIAAPGTWVTIETEGQREVHELLEPTETPVTRTQHGRGAFFDEVDGKAVGDEYDTTNDSLGTVTAKIVDVRSKYVGLFQEILQTFNRTFPKQQGLRAFAFSESESFEPLRRSLKDRAGRLDKLMEQYASMPMPLSMLGKALGISDIEVWESLAGWETGRPVHVGEGTPDALKRYVELAAGTTPLVFDATSLCALQRLGLLIAVPDLGRPLYVAQSVMDDLSEFRTRRELELRRPGDRMTLLVEGGELRRSMSTEESLKQGLGLIDDLLAWIRANCQVVGVSPGPDHHRRTLLEGLSRGAYDSILCARDHEGILVNEDLRLRSFAENEFKRPGIASIHLASGMLALGAISQERYDEAIATAAEWNYEFISLNHATVLAAYRLDGFLLGRKVEASLRRLAEPSTDAGPVVIVAADVIRELALGPLLAQRVQVMLHALLRALASRPDWRRVEPALRLRLNARLQLHPLALQTVLREISAWKRAHLLP